MLSKLKSLSLLLVLGAPALVYADTTPAAGLFAQIKPAANGTFKIGSVEFGLEHKSWTWAPALQRDLKPDAGFPQNTPEGFLLKGRFVTDSGPYDLTESLKPADGARVSYSATLSGEPTKDSRFLCLSLQLPVEDYRGQNILLDDTAFQIPWWFKGQNPLPAAKRVKSVRVPLKAGGTLLIEGDFDAFFQDNREYGAGAFDLQLMFEPHAGTIRTANLNLNLTQLPAGAPLAVAYNANAKQPARAPRSAATPQDFKPDPARIAAALARVKPLPALKPQGENFVNSNGKTIRLWGMNLVAFYPDYVLADVTADKLAALGINVVRPHHNLRPSLDWSPKDVSALMTYEADSRTPNLKAWDHYDYFNAALRAKGIYLALSLHGTRQYLPEDVSILKVSPEDDEAWASAMDDLNHWTWKKSFDPRKALPVFDERCFQLQAEFTRELLRHVNPYTGLAYGKDPQVISLELLNEYSTEYLLVCGNQFPEYWTKKLNALLADYAAAHGVPVFTLYARKTDAQRKCFSDFCNELDQKYAARLEKVVREAGYDGDLEFSNLWRGDAELRWRAATDGVIEDHAYDDPFVVGDPNRFLYSVSKSAVAGKPLVIGEMNQSENAALIQKRKPVYAMLPVATAVYSSLQNYSGVIWFAWAHGLFQLNPDGTGKPGPATEIGTLAGNETMLDHLRACGIIYKNAYLSPSADPQTVYVSPDYYPGNYNDIVNGQTVIQPGWQAVHAFRKAFGPIPAAQAAAPWLTQAPPQPTISDTNQIVRDSQRRQLSFAAPKTEGFSGYLDGQPPAKLSVLGLAGQTGFATVLTVSLDDKPLRQSDHLLLSRTYNDDASKDLPSLPVQLHGLTRGKWKLRATRPATQIVDLATTADGTLNLPGDWHECELERN